MIYNYKEIIAKVGSNYNLVESIKRGEIFKIEKGIYSDEKDINYWQVIFKKYPNVAIADQSAYYFYGLIQNEPDLYYVATKRNHTRIKDKSIKQKFYKYLNLSDAIFNSQIVTLNIKGVNLKIFSLEMLLVDFFRNKNNISIELYNKILDAFKLKITQIDLDVVEFIMYDYYSYNRFENEFEKLTKLIID